MKVQGGRMTTVPTASSTVPQFMQASATAKQNALQAWQQVVKMVEFAPNTMKNAPEFGELDRAFKLFDAALKKLELKAAQYNTNWTGTR